MKHDETEHLLNELDWQIQCSPDGEKRDAWRPLKCVDCGTKLARRYPMSRHGNPLCYSCGGSGMRGLNLWLPRDNDVSFFGTARLVSIDREPAGMPWLGDDDE